MDKIERAYLSRTYGINLPPSVVYYLPQGMALDAAQPGLITVGNSGIPAYLANYYDPDVIAVLLAANKGGVILGSDGSGEAKKGNWTDRTATFPIVEMTGEVSSYGDYSTNGSVGYNANYPQRQSYHFQTMSQWGDLELEMMALARIDAASQINKAAANALMKFQNNTYFFGVSGLQNYGILNDPNLLPPIAPGVKAFGGNVPGPWITNGVPTASANEVFTDIQTLFGQLVAQSNGLIEMDAKMCLALSPGSEVALTTTNSFNVNVADLMKKNFPNMRVESAVQYANTVTGNLVQLIAENVEGQQTGYCAFTEKMRAGRIIPDTTSFRQKKISGSWGAVIRQPFAIATMVGV